MIVYREKEYSAASRVINKARHLTAVAREKANMVALNPGYYFSKGVEGAIRNPAQSALLAAPVPGTTAVAIASGKPLERATTKLTGGLNQRASKAYEKSKASRYVEGTVNGVVGALKNLA